MAANVTTIQSSSDEDLEKVEKQPYPHMQNLLELLLTEVQSLSQSALSELNENLPTTKSTKEDTLRRNLRAVQKQNEELERKLILAESHQKDIGSNTLQAKVARLENRLSHTERSKSETEKKLKKELHDSQQTIESLQKKLNLAEEKNVSINDELTKRERYDTSIRKKLESYDNLESQLKAIKEDLKSTKAELEETKTRLSKSMGDRLTDNNPNIADLSDKNRPTKLAEQYQEIYDNEWTDAFERFDAIYKNEEKSISILTHILTLKGTSIAIENCEHSLVVHLINLENKMKKETRDFCEREADDQMEQIQKAIIQNSSSTHRHLPSNLQKHLKDCRKTIAATSGNYVYLKYKKELITSKSSIARRAGRVPDFVAACFKICWLMAVQDPPVVFGKNADHGDAFNTEVYKAYTRSGNKVDFVVWPALYLHKDGPVLCKGVAQGYKEFPRRSRSPPAKNRRQNQSNENTPENNADSKKEIKTYDIAVGVDDRSKEAGKNDIPFLRCSERSHSDTLVTRQSRTTYKQKNLNEYVQHNSPDPKPSDNDVDTFLRWRDMFGPNEARRLMGQDYDICLKYLKELGIL